MILDSVGLAGAQRRAFSPQVAVDRVGAGGADQATVIYAVDEAGEHQSARWISPQVRRTVDAGLGA